MMTTKMIKIMKMTMRINMAMIMIMIMKIIGTSGGALCRLGHVNHTSKHQQNFHPFNCDHLHQTEYNSLFSGDSSTCEGSHQGNQTLHHRKRFQTFERLKRYRRSLTFKEANVLKDLEWIHCDIFNA